MKRKATTQLTKEGWEQEIENGAKYEEEEVQGVQDTPEEISKRKIFRAKRNHPPASAPSHGKFQLVGSLTALQEAEAQNEVNPVNKSGEPAGEQKPTRNEQNNIDQGAVPTEPKSEEEAKKEEKKQGQSLEEKSSEANSAGDPTKKTQFEFGKPLFGGINAQPLFQASNLFGSKPIFSPSPNTATGGQTSFLSGQFNPLLSGFGTLSGNTGAGGTASITSFLNTGTKPFITETKQDSSGDEGPITSDSPSGIKHDEERVSLSESPYTKIYNNPVEKLKVGNESKGNGTLALEKCTLNDKTILLLVFRNKLGASLYQGSLLQDITRMKKQQGKGIKIQLLITAVSKKPDGKLTIDQCLITFGRDSERQEFGQTVKKALTSLGPAESSTNSSTEKKENTTPQKNDKASPEKSQIKVPEQKSPTKKPDSTADNTLASEKESQIGTSQEKEATK